MAERRIADMSIEELKLYQEQLLEGLAKVDFVLKQKLRLSGRLGTTEPNADQ